MRNPVKPEIYRCSLFYFFFMGVVVSPTGVVDFEFSKFKKSFPSKSKSLKNKRKKSQRSTKVNIE